MTGREAFKTDRKLDVARADNVLDLEIHELGIETKLLNDSCVFTRRQARVFEAKTSVSSRHKTLREPTILRFGTSDYHLAGSKDQSGSLGLTDTHDDGGKSLWIVFRIPRVKRNGLQIETAIEIDRSNDVSSNMPLSLNINKRHDKVYTHCKVGTATMSVICAYNHVRGKELT